MEYKIYVGTQIKIKNGFLKGSRNFMYSGMPNEHTFVMTPFMNYGYAGYSPNIYYSINSQVIRIVDKDFDVIEVTSDYIILAD